MNRSHWILVTAVSVLALGATRTARAQDTGGTVGVGGTATGTTTATPAPAATTPPPPPPAATTTTATTTAPKVDRDRDRDDGGDDHDAVIGRFAVGYLGVSQLPIATGLPGGTAGTVGRDNVNAPVIGVRYWLSQKLGLDLGVGFGITGGSSQVVAGNVSREVDSPSRLGFAFHGGVPLAFAQGKHYAFTVIPEATVGFTSGSIKTPGAPDIDLSGFRLDAGGRVGAEIYFGFIGIPQLSLQGSVGLFFRREAWKAKQSTATGDTSASVGETTFATSVQSDPWALFVNNVSAFYYF